MTRLASTKVPNIKLWLVIHQLQIPVSEVALAMGVAPSTVYGYKTRGTSSPSPEGLMAFVELARAKYGVSLSLDWFYQPDRQQSFVKEPLVPYGPTATSELQRYARTASWVIALLSAELGRLGNETACKQALLHVMEAEDALQQLADGAGQIHQTLVDACARFLLTARETLG